jgi:hypothetical protein
VGLLALRDFPFSVIIPEHLLLQAVPVPEIPGRRLLQVVLILQIPSHRRRRWEAVPLRRLSVQFQALPALLTQLFPVQEDHLLALTQPVEKYLFIQ